jgi:hypothetical protein
MITWLRAFFERFGGSGTRSGRSASLGDLGIIGPLCVCWLSSPIVPLLWFVSLTGNPLNLASSPASC